MGDFNASTGTDRAGDQGERGSMFLDFAKGQGLRVAGSWFQLPNLHHWTWYSNAGSVVKEIDHILGGRLEATADLQGLQ